MAAILSFASFGLVGLTVRAMLGAVAGLVVGLMTDTDMRPGPGCSI